MSFELSTGELARMSNLEGNAALTSAVTLQVVSNIQPLAAQQANAAAPSGGPSRYRCMVFDGEQTAIAVLPSHLAPLIEEAKISRYTVLKISKGNVSKKARTNEPPMVLIIIMEAEVLGTLSEKLGPSQKRDPSVPAQAPAPSAPEPVQNQYQQPQYQQRNFGSAAPPAQASSSSFMSRVGENKPSFSGAVQAPMHQGPRPMTHPIKDLNPYQNKWTICARVTQKSAIKTWSKPNSQGRLFSVNLLDDSSEIRATVFTQQVDMFYPILEVGKVYYVSNAQVKMARQQFSNLSNQYELTFDAGTIVEQCADPTGVPQEHFDFIPISSLTRFEKGSVVDVIGIVQHVEEITEITMKTDNRKVAKRELSVVDKSGFLVRVTLWGEEAKSFDASGEPVVAFKGIRVNDFGGRSLSLPGSGSMAVSPDIPEAHTLRGWYDAEGRSASFSKFEGGSSAGGSGGDGASRFEEQFKTMAQIRDENLGMGEAAAFFNVKGTIVFVRTTSLAYPACPTAECNKKVSVDSSGLWRCEKCDRSFDAPEHRYIFSINVSDDTGQNWLRCFDDVGRGLFGCPAGELVELQQTDEAQFMQRVQEVTYREYMFRCRARNEMFNDTTRLGITAVSLRPVDYAAESKRLARLVDMYT
ncbi:Replication factor A protein 1 [Coemansia sp. RSA 2049]|nr:Replication factor A protein 1 [Coemansia sp. RSA 2049]